MPRYFFDLNECGRRLVDEEGRELDASDDFRAIAIHEARTMMQAEIADGRLCLGCAVEIRDERGNTILCVPFKEAVKVAGLDGCEDSA
jgi:hypothetical protein